MTWVFSPFCERMFQTALTFRERLVAARTSCVTSSTSVKPRMPCLSGSLPVAIEFQIRGEYVGCSVERLPMTPALTSRCKLGISPRSRRGWMIFQSAPSQPTNSTRRRAPSGIVILPVCASLRNRFAA
jgi:hypothetical protein